MQLHNELKKACEQHIITFEKITNDEFYYPCNISFSSLFVYYVLHHYYKINVVICYGLDNRSLMLNKLFGDDVIIKNEITNITNEIDKYSDVCISLLINAPQSINVQHLLNYMCTNKRVIFGLFYGNGYYVHNSKYAFDNNNIFSNSCISTHNELFQTYCYLDKNRFKLNNNNDILTIRNIMGDYPLNRLCIAYINTKSYATISVCIPVVPYHLKYLPELLDSINSQTYKAHEVIIALSGTTEQQCNYISNEFKKAFMDINLIFTHHVSKQRIGLNRNRSAKIASGDIITFMDPDDIMHVNRLELIMDAVNKLNAKCVLHGYIKNNINLSYFNNNFNLNNINIENTNVINELTKSRFDSIQNKNDPKEYWFDKRYIHGQPSFVKEFFDSFDGGYCNEKRGSDVIFLNKVLNICSNNDMVYLDAPLVNYMSIRSTKQLSYDDIHSYKYISDDPDVTELKETRYINLIL